MQANEGVPDTSAPQDVRSWSKARFLVAFVSFWAFVCNYALRVNINLAIVEMVVPLNQTSSSGSDECGRSKTNTSNADPQGSDKFDWDESTQSWILSSVFFGYITTQLLGGRLAGGKLVLGVPLLIAGLLSLLTPMAAKSFGSSAVIGLRVMIGMAEAGSAMGTILTLAQGGVMMQAWGWESIFYFYGGLTAIWFVAWFFLVSDSPENHPYISAEEKLFILVSLSKEEKKANGLLSALPYVLLFGWTQIHAHIMDYCRSKKILSTTAVRKISNTLVMLFDAIEYLLFGSGEEQTWNNPKAADTEPAVYDNPAYKKDPY
ncbi:unnamed protein product [Notodromas monacha]|uniref:Uncharacterized protein n=1 Tax=Notodromas monacha TaxID=399045 RepID=A0A7R9BTM2_9CRUS|nr:unnamed protein product [Notodromas monacha]CAG0919919.1 unnamed protein product [Notodromas monacha]